MHLCIQSGFLKGFFAIFNLRTNLNDFFLLIFSILQIALPTKTRYARVVQIANQLNKISYLMHLYIQSEFFARYFAFFHFSSSFFFQFCKLHELGVLLMDLRSKFQTDIIKIQMWCTYISKMFMKNIKWGWGKHSSNLWKVQHALLLHVVRLFENKKHLPPCTTKWIYLWPLGGKCIPINWQ
jgi:hypothetical protein